MKKSIKTKYQVYIIKGRKRDSIYEQCGTSPLDALRNFIEPRRHPDSQFTYKRLNKDYFEIRSLRLFPRGLPSNYSSRWRVYEKEHPNQV